MFHHQPLSLPPLHFRITKYLLLNIRSTRTRVTVNGIPDVIHAARCNYLGMSGHEELNKESEDVMRKYGVGACGPRGFYGTIGIVLLLDRLTELGRCTFGVGEKVVRMDGHRRRNYLFIRLCNSIKCYSRVF